jgi:ribonuclease HII
MEMFSPPNHLLFNSNKKDFYEDFFWNQNKTVCGVDEVGRGCLGGPLLVAAVILHPYVTHPLLVDSKQLTGQQLVQAYDWIVGKSTYAVAWGSPALVDTVNIYQATLLTMKRAYMQLTAKMSALPSAVLVDAMPLRLSGLTESPQVFYFPKGESLSRSIAAASIIAKVTRDRFVRTLDMVVPGYRFSDHKGYGTAVHKKALRALGSSLVHRSSFLSNVITERNTDDACCQKSIC